MATIAFQGLGPAAALVEAPARPARRGVLLTVSQALCGWRRSGHEMLLRTEGPRLYLQCRHCLRETPGWSMSEDALGRRVTAPKATGARG
jgi:hypothetical protein